MRFVLNSEAAYRAYTLPCTYLYERELAVTANYGYVCVIPGSR